MVGEHFERGGRGREGSGKGEGCGEIGGWAGIGRVSEGIRGGCVQARQGKGRVFYMWDVRYAVRGGGVLSFDRLGGGSISTSSPQYSYPVFPSLTLKGSAFLFCA